MVEVTAAVPRHEARGNRDTWQAGDMAAAASLDTEALWAALATGPDGLSDDEARVRREAVGPNALVRHGVRVTTVLLRQLDNPLLVLLVVAALVSIAVGQRLDAGVILVIVALSIGLGFVNEYRSERTIEALHRSVAHRAVLHRDGHIATLDVVDLVPGDVVEIRAGDIVPADLRLTDVDTLECDEAVLTGEPEPVVKVATPVTGARHDQATVALNGAFMGTVVTAGAGTGVVVATGPAAMFGRIATELGAASGETAFQAGLRAFSGLLVRVAAVLCGGIFLINLILGRGLLEAGLFALAIAVGITPQLLPAIVTVSLSAGASQLARRKVVVKRLVSIEDLGNMQVLCTDKTGTLTEGHVRFVEAIGSANTTSTDVIEEALASCDVDVADGAAVGGNALDVALWEGAPTTARTRADRWKALTRLPFDHDRRLGSALVTVDGHRRLVTKGAPEAVLDRCSSVPDATKQLVDEQFATGARLVAVATRDASAIDPAALTVADERELTLAGLLVFEDRPKADAGEALSRLAALGVEVKVITGDNPTVAAKVCRELGMTVDHVVTGDEVDEHDDATLAATVSHSAVFARMSPDQKSRVIQAQRAAGVDVAFLGDGVNDAVALHHADVGISVDTATDVAKDAADVVLLDKDLGVVADGVVEGRRIFANTVKYVLMATSSNFGNMLSAAGASIFLSFLPMLPTQILVNNLLYDVGQLAIPTDEVDPEQLARPAHWDLRLIKRFMAWFGPISSVFDALTFVLLLEVLHAGVREFRSGWFIESLATQTLVVFVIRTRRVPFFRSRPSRAMIVTPLLCAGIGAALPFSPLAHVLGFVALPASFGVLLLVMIVAYLALTEVVKSWFFRETAAKARATPPPQPVAAPRSRRSRRVRRRASRWHAATVNRPRSRRRMQPLS